MAISSVRAQVNGTWYTLTGLPNAIGYIPISEQNQKQFVTM